jgi:hypothetical protein
MSSLIFNVGLILLCSVAVAQFCTIAFSDYARYTASLCTNWSCIRETNEQKHCSEFKFKT